MHDDDDVQVSGVFGVDNTSTKPAKDLLDTLQKKLEAELFVIIPLTSNYHLQCCKNVNNATIAFEIEIVQLPHQIDLRGYV